MRLQVIVQLSSNESSQTVIATLTAVSTAITSTSTIVKILATILPPCTYCGKQGKMAGAFAAYKVRDHLNASCDNGNGSSWAGSDQKPQSSYFQSTTMKVSSDRDSNPPAKYNEKMMMSIWGLYNKYSVHNIKSHNTFEARQ